MKQQPPAGSRMASVPYIQERGIRELNSLLPQSHEVDFNNILVFLSHYMPQSFMPLFLSSPEP
jgi:hypothetical protein